MDSGGRGRGFFEDVDQQIRLIFFFFFFSFLFFGVEKKKNFFFCSFKGDVDHQLERSNEQYKHSESTKVNLEGERRKKETKLQSLLVFIFVSF